MVLFLANHQFVGTLNTTAGGSKMYYILEMHLFRLGSRKPKRCNVVDKTVLEQLYLRMHTSNLDEDFEFLGTVQLDSCSLENWVLSTRVQWLFLSVIDWSNTDMYRNGDCSDIAVLIHIFCAGLPIFQILLFDGRDFDAKAI